MLAILNSFNTHNFPIFQPIKMILVSNFTVHRALSEKHTYLSLGLLSPLKCSYIVIFFLLSGKASSLVLWTWRRTWGSLVPGLLGY